MKAKKRIKRLILVIVATIIAYIFLVPLLFMVFTSFKGLSESISSSDLLPHIWTLENYVSILEDTTTSPIMRWLLNTTIVTVTGTVLVVAVDCLAAYALARLNLPFKNKVIVFLIWVMTIPGIVTTFPSFYLFREIELVNTFVPLIVPYTANATGVYLIYNFLIDFPVSLEEAARIDGCPEAKTFIYVMAPLASSTFVTLAIFSFMWRWNDYILPLLVLSDQKNYTIQIAIKNFIGNTGVDWSSILSASVISMIPVTIIFVILQRYIIGGVSAGGVKG